MTAMKTTYKKLKGQYIKAGNVSEKHIHHQTSDNNKCQTEDTEMFSCPMENDDSNQDGGIKGAMKEESAPNWLNDSSVSQMGVKVKTEIDEEDENNYEVKYKESSHVEASLGENVPGEQHSHDVGSDVQATGHKEVSFSQILANIAETALGPAAPQKPCRKTPPEQQTQSVLQIQSNESDSEYSDRPTSPSSKSSVVIVFSGKGQPTVYSKEQESTGRALISHADGNMEGRDNVTGVSKMSATRSSDSLKVLEVAHVLSELSQIGGGLGGHQEHEYSPALPQTAESDDQSHLLKGGVKRGWPHNEKSIVKRGRMEADFNLMRSELVVDQALMDKLGITEDMDDGTRNLLLLAEQICQENVAVVVKQNEKSIVKRGRMEADFNLMRSELVVDQALMDKLGITEDMDDGTRNLLLLAEQICRENVAVVVRQKSRECNETVIGHVTTDAATEMTRMSVHPDTDHIRSKQCKEENPAQEASDLCQYNARGPNHMKYSSPEKDYNPQGSLDLLCEAVNAVKSDEMKADVNIQHANLGLIKQEPMEWVEFHGSRTSSEQTPTNTSDILLEKDRLCSEDGCQPLSMMKATDKAPPVKFVHLDLSNWKIGEKLVKKLTDHPLGMLEQRGITRELALNPSGTTATSNADLTVGEFLELYFTALWFQHSGIKLQTGLGNTSGKFSILHKWLRVFYGLTDNIAKVKFRTESILDMYMMAEEKYKEHLSAESFQYFHNFLTSTLLWQTCPCRKTSLKSVKVYLQSAQQGEFTMKASASSIDCSGLQNHLPQLAANLTEVQADTSTGPEHGLTDEAGETSNEFSSEESDDDEDSVTVAMPRRGRPRNKMVKGDGKYDYKYSPKQNLTVADKRSNSTTYKRPYSPKFRLQVLKFAEINANNSAASRKFGVSVRQIRKWRERKTDIYRQAGLEDQWARPPDEQTNASNSLSHIKQIMGPKVKKKYSSHTPVGRQRLRPWLAERIGGLQFPGLEWIDRDTEVFKVPWKHWKNSGWLESDSLIFKEWAINTGRFNAGERPEWAAWKTRLRCALNQMPDITELKHMRSKKTKTPYRVFKFTNKEKKDTEQMKTGSKSSSCGTLSPVVHSDSLNIPTLVAEIAEPEIAEPETVVKAEPLSPGVSPPTLSVEVDLSSHRGTCTEEGRLPDTWPVIASLLETSSRPTKDAKESLPTHSTKYGLPVGSVNGVPVLSMHSTKEANNQPQICSGVDEIAVHSTRGGQPLHSGRGSNCDSLIKTIISQPLIESYSSEDGDKGTLSNLAVNDDQTVNSGNDECDSSDNDETMHLKKVTPSKSPRKYGQTRHSRNGGSTKDSTKDMPSKHESPKTSDNNRSPKCSAKDRPPKLSTKIGSLVPEAKDAVQSPPMLSTGDDEQTDSNMADCPPAKTNSDYSSTVVKEEAEDNSQTFGPSMASNEDCLVFYKSI